MQPLAGTQIAQAGVGGGSRGRSRSAREVRRVRNEICWLSSCSSSATSQLSLVSPHTKLNQGFKMEHIIVTCASNIRRAFGAASRSITCFPCGSGAARVSGELSRVSL